MQFKLSQEAEADLRIIAQYTPSKWGAKQRRKYIDAMYEKFTLVAENPFLGRKCDHVRVGYFRLDYASHIIFYCLYKEDTLISRILHKSMDVEMNLPESLD